MILPAGLRPTSASGYPVQATVSYVFVQTSDVTSSYLKITFGGIVLNPALAPSEVVVSYSIAVNGVLYYSNGCVIYHLTWLTYTPCSVTVPYHASASYLLTATYKNHSGQLVADLIIDPLAEPEWNYK